MVAPPDEFDSINLKYNLTGKRAARTIADAIWEAMPKDRPYCLDRIDLDALNRISLVTHGGGDGFRLPEHVYILAQEAKMKPLWDEQKRAWQAQVEEEKRRRAAERAAQPPKRPRKKGKGPTLEPAPF